MSDAVRKSDMKLIDKIFRGFLMYFYQDEEKINFLSIHLEYVLLF